MESRAGAAGSMVDSVERRQCRCRRGLGFVRDNATSGRNRKGRRRHGTRGVGRGRACARLEPGVTDLGGELSPAGDIETAEDITVYVTSATQHELTCKASLVDEAGVSVEASADTMLTSGENGIVLRFETAPFYSQET